MEETSKRREILHRSLVECVQGYVDCLAGTMRLPVILVGRKHADLMERAFRERGICVQRAAEMSQEEQKGKYVIELENYFSSC